MNLHSEDNRTLDSYDLSEIVQNIPNFITLLRIVILPNLVCTFNHQITLVSYVLFLFAIGTDLLDGFIARKLNSVSRFGAYLDVSVDFLFIFGMYLNFILQGIYSLWILLMMVFVFSQFVLSNLYLKQTIYDPVGKYYGSLLFGGIGLTLLFSHPILYQIVTFGIILSTFASLISRLIYFFYQRPKRKQPD
jgi:CDP-diacylglycerol--glycerol-3-phosphate 3-phosphatidyltransferase